MPRRNLTTTKIWIHPRRKPDDLIQLDSIPGNNEQTHDYLSLFHGFVQEVTHTHLHNADKEQWTNVIDIPAPRGRTVLVGTETGKYGEEGTAVDIDTGMSDFAYSKNHSIQVLTHGMLFVPQDSTYALLFQERSNGRCGAGRLHTVFITEFQKAFPNLKVKTTPVLESEAWLEAAELMEVEVEVTKPSSDEADFDIPALSKATFSYSIRPSSEQKSLPRRLYDQLMGRDIKPGQLIGLAKGTETGKVLVTFAKDGRQKRFELYRANQPVASLLLTNHGEAALSTSAIQGKCIEEAEDYFRMMGIEWNESMAHGNWSQDQLDVRTVKPDDEQT